VSELASAWRDLPLNGAPYALAADLELLGPAQKRWLLVKDYRQYVETCLAEPNDSRLHLSLLPQPFFGDLELATVFLLLLNPGLNPGDYYSEYCVPAYRAALISNLRQEANREFPLLFLDPEFSWHPGARYFRTRLHWIASRIARRDGIAYRDALGVVARRVCALQLVPYHSPVFHLPSRILDRLESTGLARQFAGDRLLDRQGVLVLVMRQAGRWGLSDRPGVINYFGSETRAAHLSPDSRGGKALANHFNLSAS
jgi:hypothetical protein